MPRPSRTLARVLSGVADQNLRFADLRTLLRALQFEERIRGSHHIYTRNDLLDILNLQPREGGKAKPYQVQQVRNVILRRGLAEELANEQ